LQPFALLLPILAAASLLIVTASAAIAADVSPWDDDAQSAARLIAARAINESGGRMFRAGVEIKLKTAGRPTGGIPVTPACRRAGFFQVAKRQSRHRALSGADAVSRRRGGNSIGYKGA
jgi:hypothetical protein